MPVTAPGLDQQATIFGRGTAGTFTVALRTGLECRLSHLGINEGIMTGPQRREISSIRLLIFNPSYTLPENVQVVVAGVVGADGVTLARFNVEAGSVSVRRGPRGTPVFASAIVVRAS